VKNLGTKASTNKIYIVAKFIAYLTSQAGTRATHFKEQTRRRLIFPSKQSLLPA
jgi:hypothetical protein